MRRKVLKKDRSRIKKLFDSSLSLLKACIAQIAKFSKLTVGYLFVEICFWLITLGIGYLFISLGFSYNMANYAALALMVGVLILIFIFDSWRKSKKAKKGTVRLATWIAKNISDRESSEWSEYQDWLHDILLARQQLLAAKCPKWKVFLITYWRLSGFLVVVGLTKIKNAAVAVMKLR